MDLDAEVLEQLGRRIGQPFRQGRQDSVGRLDQVNLYVLFRIDPIESVGDELARRVVELGRELGSSRTGADDGDVKLPRPERFRLGVGADAGIYRRL